MGSAQEGEGVVAEVVVEVDDAGDNEGVTGVDYGGLGEACGGWGACGGDGFDEARVVEVDAAFEDG